MIANVKKCGTSICNK